MKKQHPLILTAAMTALLYLGGCAATEMQVGRKGPPPQLQEAQHAIQAVLDGLDADLAEAAALISATGLDSPKTREALAALSERHPSVVDACTVDAAGVMVAVEPAAYRSAEGSDISAQEQVIRLHATQQPVLSTVFTAVEGFPAVDLERPVMAADGSLAGSASMLIQHASFLSRILLPVVSGTRWDCWVMQTDGVILYDPDPIEVGLNTFKDPLYTQFPEFVAMARRIAEAPSGSGSYRFYRTGLGRRVTKDCHWQTVGLHGTEWRVCLVREQD